MGQLLTGRHDPTTIDPFIFTRDKARRDPRIQRAWRGGRLVYSAMVDDALVESHNILEIFDMLPDPPAGSAAA